MRRLGWSVGVFALVVSVAIALAQVTGPDPSVNTSCGVSGVDPTTGTCLNAVGGGDVSSGSGGGGNCLQYDTGVCIQYQSSSSILVQ